jgi:guanylate kinase
LNLIFYSFFYSHILQYYLYKYIIIFKLKFRILICQQEIVDYCEYNDTLIKQLETEIENNKKQAQKFITDILKAQFQIE